MFAIIARIAILAMIVPSICKVNDFYFAGCDVTDLINGGTLNYLNYCIELMRSLVFSSRRPDKISMIIPVLGTVVGNGRNKNVVGQNNSFISG